MKRYYLCDLVGTGTEDDPYRPATVDMGASNFSAVYPPQDMQTGAYLGTNVLVIVGAPSHLNFLGKPGVDPLPDFPLHGRMSAITASAVNALQDALTRRGMEVTWVSSEGWNAVLRRIGRAIDANFHESNFDVSD